MVEGAGATIEQRVALLLMSRGLAVRPCGLNADWAVSAWALSDGEPNTVEGGFYLLDTEETDEHGEPLFEVVQRFYTADDPDGDGNDTVKGITGPGRLAPVVNEWLFSDARKEAGR
jgi:hypothetical protein